MLMIPPNLSDCPDSCQGGGREAGAAVGDNLPGPLWQVGLELHSQSSLTVIVAEIRRPDRRRWQDRERPTGRPISPGGLMVV